MSVDYYFKEFSWEGKESKRMVVRRSGRLRRVFILFNVGEVWVCFYVVEEEIVEESEVEVKEREGMFYIVVCLRIEEAIGFKYMSWLWIGRVIVYFLGLEKGR